MRYIILGLIVVGVIVIGYLVYGNLTAPNPIDLARSETQAVQTAVVQYMSLKDKTYDGVIGPGRKADPSGPEKYINHKIECRYTFANGFITDAVAPDSWNLVWNQSLVIWQEKN